MKNAIKVLALCFFAIGMTIFTSCGSDDNTTDPNDLIVCDSLTAQINVAYDSLETVLSVETYGFDGPFVYIWSTGETTNSINVGANDLGTYSVTVTADAVADCEAVGTIDLTGNTPDCNSLTAEITMSPDSSNITFLTASASGGTAPYSYLWSTGDAGNWLEITEEGTYGVSITDANGCVTGTAYTYEDNNNTPCDDFMGSIDTLANSGEISLTGFVSGGTAPYAYEWSTGETTMDIIVTTSGTYTLNVIDANGCVISLTYSFNNNDPCDNFYITIFSQPDSINMGQDFLYGYAAGGSAPYSYLWSTGETVSTIDISNTIETSFSVTATDSNGCTAEDTIEL